MSTLKRIAARLEKADHAGFERKMQAANIPANVIEAIMVVAKKAQFFRNPSAEAYAMALERSFDDYGVDGLKMQVMYFLVNAREWSGEEARAYKATLKKWSSK